MAARLTRGWIAYHHTQSQAPTAFDPTYGSLNTLHTPLRFVAFCHFFCFLSVVSCHGRVNSIIPV